MRVGVLNPKCLWVNSASNEYQTNIALFCVGKEMHIQKNTIRPFVNT